MQIKPSDTVTAVQALEREMARSGKVKSPRTKPDRVSLSPEAQRMQQKDLERLAEIAREVREGRYKIDLDQIAEATVRKEML